MADQPPLSRTRIVAAARRIIEVEGAEALSLRRVARDLGVTAPALYAHLGSKAELLAAVAGEYFAELADRFAAVERDDPVEEIRALSRAYVEHALASPHLFRLLFRYPPSTPGIQVDGVEGFDPATRAFEVAHAATKRAVEHGLLASDDPTMAAVTMWVAVHGVAEVLLMGVDVGGERSLIDTVIDTVLAGQAASATRTGSKG